MPTPRHGGSAKRPHARKKATLGGMPSRCAATGRHGLVRSSMPTHGCAVWRHATHPHARKKATD